MKVQTTRVETLPNGETRESVDVELLLKEVELTYEDLKEMIGQYIREENLKQVQDTYILLSNVMYLKTIC